MKFHPAPCLYAFPLNDLGPPAMHVDIPRHIRYVEAKLRERGVTLNRFYAAADISNTTWMRWKNESMSPRISVWNRVVAAFEALMAGK